MHAEKRTSDDHVLTDVEERGSHNPPNNDSLSLKSGAKIDILSRISAGGEGTIYNISDPDLVCKVYHFDKRTTDRQQKIRLMLDKRMSYEGICWPKDEVLNQKGETVGYIMQKAQGVELARSLWQRPLLEKHFPLWDKFDTVRLALTILDKINYLHSHDILIGDINASNILVKDADKVYFIDTDSYQVDGLPCPVGTIHFTPPEFQGKDWSKTPRELGHELFAVATLLFMIMLPGKAPYASQGGGDIKDSISKGDFPYSLKERGDREKMPAGVWRYCWSHLPDYIQNGFYHTFHRSGNLKDMSNRLSVEEWINRFARYERDLKDGTLIQQDPDAIRLFPPDYNNKDNLKEEGL